MYALLQLLALPTYTNHIKKFLLLWRPLNWPIWVFDSPNLLHISTGIPQLGTCKFLHELGPFYGQVIQASQVRTSARQKNGIKFGWQEYKVFVRYILIEILVLTVTYTIELSCLHDKFFFSFFFLFRFLKCVVPLLITKNCS